MVFPFKNTALWLKRLMFVLALLLILCGGLFALLQTGPGLRLSARLAAGMVSGLLGQEVRIEGVRGLLPFRLEVERIQAADAEGVWLEASDVYARVSPSALLRGRIAINEAGANAIHLARIPEWPAPETPREWALPQMPGLPGWIRADSVTVERFSMAEEVLGTAGEFRGEARYQPQERGGDWEAELHIVRLDAPTTRATLAIALKNSQLAVELLLDDSEYLPALGDFEGPVHFTLSGSGAAMDWPGVLRAVIADRELFSGELRLAAGKSTGLRLKATADLEHPAVPPQSSRYLGSELTLDAVLELNPEGVLNIASAQAGFPAGKAAVQGRIDLPASTIEAGFQARYDRWAEAAGIEAEEPPPLSISGAWRGPLASGNLNIEAMLGEAPLLESQWRIALAGTEAFGGEFRAWPMPPLIPEGAMVLLRDGLAGRIQLERTPAGAFSIADAAVSAQGLKLEVRGNIDLNTLELDANLRLAVENPAALDDLIDTPLPENLVLLAELRADGTASSFSLELDAGSLTLEDLRFEGVQGRAQGTAAGFTGLFGALEVTAEGMIAGLSYPPMPPGDWTLALEASAPSFDEIVMKHIEISDKNLALQARGTLSPSTQTGAGNLSLTAADIAPVAAWFDQAITGSFELHSEVTLPGDALPLNAVLDGRWTGLAGLPEAAEALLGAQGTLSAALDVSPESIAAQNIAITAAQTRIEGNASYAFADRAVSGDLRARLHDLALLREAHIQPESARSIDTTISLGGTLDRLRIAATARAGANEASGTLTLNLDGLTVAGAFDLNAPDLAYLSPWAGTPLEGAATGHIEIDTGVDPPRLSTSLRARQIVTPALQVGEARIEANIRHLFDRPRGKLSLTATQARLSRLDLTSVSLEAEGGADTALASLTIEGLWDGGSPMNAAGDLSVDWPQGLLTLQRLEGRIGEYPLRLEAPARAQYAESQFRLPPAVLAVGEGSITLEAAHKTDFVTAAAVYRQIPLGLAGTFGAPPVTGALSGEARLSGAPANPRIDLQAHIPGFQLAETVDAPALEVHLDGRLAEGRLAIEMKAQAPDAATASATLNAPLLFQVTPWRFLMPPEGQLEGGFDAVAQLAPMAKWIDLQHHRPEGIFTANFHLEGTWQEPHLTGSAALDSVSYENPESGTLLRNLNAVLRATSGILELARLESSDAADGRLVASGHIRLGAGTRLPIDTTFEMRRMQVVRRDDLKAQVDGALRITGTPEHAKIGGDLTLAPVYINLAPYLAVSHVPTLEVHEINSASPREEARASGPAPTIELDIQCRVPGRLYINAPVLDSEWQGNLHVTGTLDTPRIAGAMQVRRGHFEFLGRRFELADSIIQFTGQHPPHPYLNIVAVADTRDLKATLRLTGALASLTLDLSSEPPVPRDEVLARVLFGKNVAQITPMQAVQLARVAALFSSDVPGMQLLGGGVRLPGIDRIDLRTGDTAEETSVGLGKYLTEQIYLEVEQGVAADSTRGTVRVEITPQISAEAQVGADAKAGGGLFWKKDY